MGIPDCTEGDTPNPSRRLLLRVVRILLGNAFLFDKIFTKSCTKMKEIGPRGYPYPPNLLNMSMNYHFCFTEEVNFRNNTQYNT